MSRRSTVLSTMRQIAEEQGKALAPFSDDLMLLESGLDSLGVAILVARLEDELGIDPFAGEDNVDLPLTLGDFIRVYENTAV